MIYWILVNYYNESDIIALMSSCSDSDIIFVVVDNSDTFLLDSFHLSNLKLLKPNKNLGYIGGFQFAVKELDLFNCKKVILSNSDIRLLSDLSCLKSMFEQGIVVPSVINLEGKMQNPHLVLRPRKLYFLFLYFLSSFKLFWSIFMILRNVKSLFPKIISLDNDHSSIYAGHGSFLYFNGLDLNYFAERNFNFLFGEEIHFAEFCVRSNFLVIFDSKLEIEHREHSTTSFLDFDKSRMFYRDSYKFILNSYYK